MGEVKDRMVHFFIEFLFINLDISAIVMTTSAGSLSCKSADKRQPLEIIDDSQG